MKFRSVRQVFCSMLHPDYFGGFPGYYLSTREVSGTEIANFKLGVIAPEGLKDALKAASPFIGNLRHISYTEYQKPPPLNIQGLNKEGT